MENYCQVAGKVGTTFNSPNFIVSKLQTFLTNRYLCIPLEFDPVGISGSHISLFHFSVRFPQVHLSAKLFVG